ncbi:MAG: T9SS type A sorting domain-containing protein [Saprospirales bacterium]|nr:T9SS type A sorting domain-containing protein [Saprospirales bacterium]
MENGKVDLSSMPTGLYFIELTGGQQTITKRGLKQ